MTFLVLYNLFAGFLYAHFKSQEEWIHWLSYLKQV